MRRSYTVRSQHPAENINRAIDFYSAVFSWQLHSMPMARGERPR